MGMDANARRWYAPLLAVVGLCGVKGATACSETGPDAEDRKSGCLTDCAPVDAATSSGGPTIGPDGAIVYGDPLQGTSRAATLVKGGYRFTEGPVWIGGKLLFTEMRFSQILKLEPDNSLTVFRSGTGTANGLAVDPSGALLACETNQKRITRSPDTSGNATRTPISTGFGDAGFNQTNDIVARGDGTIYFTDPNYTGQPNVQPDESVYRINTAGETMRLAQSFAKPNGIALSGDGNVLYVVDNGTGKLFAGAVAASGDVASFAPIADVPGGDGMAVDLGGNLYVADDAGIEVFTSTGSKIGTITVAVKPSNCAFGGADLKTLYITANGEEPGGDAGNPQTGLYSIKLNVPGLP